MNCVTVSWLISTGHASSELRCVTASLSNPVLFHLYFHRWHHLFKAFREQVGTPQRTHKKAIFCKNRSVQNFCQDSVESYAPQLSVNTKQNLQSPLQYSIQWNFVVMIIIISFAISMWQAWFRNRRSNMD